MECELQKKYLMLTSDNVVLKKQLADSEQLRKIMHDEWQEAEADLKESQILIKKLEYSHEVMSKELKDLHQDIADGRAI